MDSEFDDLDSIPALPDTGPEGPLLSKQTFTAPRISLKKGLLRARIRPKTSWGERQKYSESCRSLFTVRKDSKLLKPDGREKAEFGFS